MYVCKHVNAHIIRRWIDRHRWMDRKAKRYILISMKHHRRFLRLVAGLSHQPCLYRVCVRECVVLQECINASIHNVHQQNRERKGGRERESDRDLLLGDSNGSILIRVHSAHHFLLHLRRLLDHPCLLLLNRDLAVLCKPCDLGIDSLLYILCSL